MNPLERKIGRSRSINSLPNYSPAGSYCFFSQCIFLNHVERKDLEIANGATEVTLENISVLLKFLPLLNHEAKHWYDAHSTLWGLRLLSSIYSCRSDLFEAEKSGISTELHHFDKQMGLRDTIQYIKYPEYYSTKYPSANTSQPWQYEYSAGILFSKYGKPTDKHLFFTRFQNADKKLIARVPFSVCALLESSAVAQELNTKIQIISSIEDPVTRKIESDKFEKEIVSELYDENLVEYSVVAHKVSNAFGIVDVLDAYNISSKLTRFILNLTDDVIDLIDPQVFLPKKLSNFFQPYISAIKYKDLGGIFSLLVDALEHETRSNGASVTNDNLEIELDKLFSSKIGLSLEDIFTKSKSYISELTSPVNYSLEKEHIDRTMELGKELHSKLGLIGNHFINLNQEVTPEFILGDNTFISQQGGDMDEFERRYYELTGYYEYLENFAKACIV